MNLNASPGSEWRAKAPASRTHSRRFATNTPGNVFALAFGVRPACRRFRSIYLAALIIIDALTLCGAEINTAYRAPSLTITNDSGVAIPLFSAAAYRAEFKYLQRIFRETDLQGPPVQTDGWTYNIAEAEWPLMSFAYFGYACLNLAQSDAGFRKEALEETRWLIEAIQTPRISGFMTPHFGPPFNPTNKMAAVFVHGHWLQLAMHYRQATGDTRYDAAIHRVARVLADGFGKSDQALLKSYPTMWWISDNFPAHAALCLYDETFQENLSNVRLTLIKNLRAIYLDKTTGLVATYVDADKRQVNQGPRGISTMYGLHFLKDVDANFARQQYAAAASHFIRSALGLAAVREFPEGASGAQDIDSGPVLLGFGPSASGFAIAAAAVMGDEETAWQLLQASAFVGLPVWHGGELHYTLMPPVGQAVILFGKTTLAKAK